MGSKLSTFINSKYIKYKRKNNYEINFKQLSYFQIEGKKKSKSSINQDTISNFSLNVDNVKISYFAVYDGHGEKGKQASQYINEYIEDYITSQSKNTLINWDSKEKIENIFSELFGKIQDAMTIEYNLYKSSGSCVLGVLIINIAVYFINLGDSRGVIGSKSNNNIYAIEMTEDHKPYVSAELERIINSGGNVLKINEYNFIDNLTNSDEYNNANEVKELTGIPFRIFKKNENFPGITISRSLGDIDAHDIGVIETPQISYKSIEEYDDFIVIGSDGLFDALNSVEIVKFIYDKQKIITKENIAKALVVEAKKRWEILNSFKLKLFSERYLEFDVNKNIDSDKKYNDINNKLNNKNYHNKNANKNDVFKLNKDNNKDIFYEKLNDHKSITNKLDIENFKNNLTIDDISCLIYFISK